MLVFSPKGAACTTTTCPMATSTFCHTQQFIITFKFSPNQVAKKQVSCLFRFLFHRDWVEKKVVLELNNAIAARVRWQANNK